MKQDHKMPPMSMKAAMKKVEASREDRARDKRSGTKEGSPADMQADRAQAKREIGKKRK